MLSGTVHSEARPIRMSDAAKRDMRIMYIAKHALAGGKMDKEDGNHAIYHHEMRMTLESLGIDNLRIANSYDVLFTDPGVDMVFPMLNRGGFMNSEMLLPLLCNRLDIPYVGGSPIIRGLGDDKHLSKLVAQAAGVPTAPWVCFRRQAPVDVALCPKADRWVIKPNASSASWGVSDAHDLETVAQAVADIHAMGHDAIVEPYLDGYDVQIPFISNNGPAMLPMLFYEREDTQRLWTYGEKRDLIQNNEKSTLKQFTDPEFAPVIEKYCRLVAAQFRPFDFGRVEFRFDPKTASVNFIEINLSCNLWSEKVIGRAAAMAGFSHADLIETILADALVRHGLMAPAEG